MTQREQADKAFADADIANSQKWIDELVSLASMYKGVLSQKAYASALMSRFKEKLKESEFDLDDVITVLNLQKKDDYNAGILTKAGGANNENTDESDNVQEPNA